MSAVKTSPQVIGDYTVEGQISPHCRSLTALPHDLYRRAFDRFSTRVAVHGPDLTLTYADLDAASNRVANYLLEMGVKQGDSVALLLRNSAAFMVADIAIVKLGCVKVPLNEMLSREDVEYMIGHAGARALIAHSSFADLLESMPKTLAELVCCIEVKDTDSYIEDFASYDAIVHMGDADPPARPNVGPEDAGLIIYTGGTTGQPKGVVHVQQAIGLNLISQALNGQIHEDEHLLLCSPLPHSAQFFAEAALICGAQITIHQGFDLEAVLDTVQAQGITWTFMVPTMIYRLLDHLRGAEHDITSIRTIVYGASPITQQRLKQALDTFGPVFLQIYGQTEAPNFITTLSKSDHLCPEYQTSCGQPVIFCDVSIRNERGERLDYEEVGEITASSPYTLARYHDAPDKTAEAYFGSWLRTGDVGYQTQTGHIYLVDRSKDMIISGGMNVYSTEVENVVQSHPEVKDVMVIGVPDDDWGEAVTAFVVPAGDTASAENIIAYCKQKLAKYKVPKAVEMISEIPLTAYGKPDKKAMRATYWTGQARNVN